jgi:S-adenosylmethionine synthetase
MKNFTFTSESVCAGHPDKICDQISDAIVDEVLRQDPYGRVAVETIAANNHIILAGEVTANARMDYEQIARKQIKRLGYTDPAFNFSYSSPLDNYIHAQSPEIAEGVKKKGAGDQGMMFGFAVNETSALMPLPISIAHTLTRAIDKAREKKVIPYLRPDGKSQVSVAYQDNKPIAITSVVLAVPHEEHVSLPEVKHDLLAKVIEPVLASFGFQTPKAVIVNGTGVWHRGGPSSDAGLTGRKIVVDTYGGYARVGGGAFSGKDPTKVDRSGAYAARFLAKNIVAHDLADRAEVSLAYFIGAKKPLMQEVETFGTEKVSQKALKDFMNELLDTSVEGILEGLSLRQPLYLPSAAYGHFGRKGFPWENIVKK